MLKAHGEYSVKLKGNILYIKLMGGFNDLGSLQLVSSIKEKIKSLKGQRFCILIDDTKAQGFTPEGYQVIENYNKWLLSQKLIAKAFVTKSFLQEEIDNIYIPSKKHQVNKTFDNLESALTWLQKQD